jgi:serine protease Do
MRAAWAVAGLVLSISGQAEAKRRHAVQVHLGERSAATATVRPDPGGALWTERPLLKRALSVPSLAPLVRATSPSVVSITTTQVARVDAATDALAAVADGKVPEQLEKGLGSGFIIRADGLILTNAHVIRGARDIVVAIEDGHRQLLPADVVGVDEATDIALLQVHAGRALRPLPLGDSDQVEVGEWVVAQGNPFGLSHTVSVGVISYVGRSDVMPEGHQGFHDYLQTDTAINPGSSGGPLVDLQGRVVGIANSVNPSGQGIAFALPINMAKSIVPALVLRGRVQPAWLGLHVQDLSPDLADSFGVGQADGVVISDLDERGPAAQGGLHTGDVVVSFDGHRVRHAQHLRWLAASAPTDRAVPMEVRREGSRMRVALRLRALPESGSGEGAVNELGARFAPVQVPDARAAGLSVPTGARVEALAAGGPAVAAGLRVGDVVTRINTRDVTDPEDLAQVLTLSGRAAEMELVVHRRGQVVVLRLASPPVQ